MKVWPAVIMTLLKHLHGSPDGSYQSQGSMIQQSLVASTIV